MTTRDMRKWLKRVGLPCHSPHKFCHGHAVFAIKMARDVHGLKAISQNRLHYNLSITDGVYGILSGSDVRKRILELGSNGGGNLNVYTVELITLARELLERMEKN